MRTVLLCAALWAGAALAADHCMENCDKVPEPCTKACKSKGGANAGMCKSRCDDAAKKCKEACAKGEK
jgi:hypothetical protein